MPTTPGAALLRCSYFAAASLAACAVVDARSSVHLTCDNNLRINPPEGECEGRQKKKRQQRRGIEIAHGRKSLQCGCGLGLSMVAHFPLRTAS